MRISNTDTDGFYEDDAYNHFPLRGFIFAFILAIIIGTILGNNCVIYYG